jgi:hypothetical protein
VSEERVVAYLRERGRVEPPADLVLWTMAAVDARDQARSPFLAGLPGAAIAAVVVVVALAGLLLGQVIRVGPGATPTSEASPTPASVEELRSALEAATATLREAPGVEGTMSASIQGELSAATWFRWRPDGDQLVVERVDVDVSESGWWLDPEGEPPGRGSNVRETIRMVAGQRYFEGTASGWTVADEAEAPPALSLITGVLDGDVDLWRDALAEDAGQVAVTRFGGGGEEWSLVAPFREGTAVSRWRIGAGGELQSWSYETQGVRPTVDDTNPITSALVELEVLSEEPTIEAPDVGTAPDANALGLPPDFPLGDGDSPG